MIVGVDIGTSLTKASAVYHDGRVGASASVSTLLQYGEGGHVEQSLEIVMQSVASVVRQVLQTASEAVEGIAITGQGDGLWLRDERGSLVRPAISWMDARAADIVDDWRAGGDQSVVSQVFRLTGSGTFPGSQAALLRWLSDNEPESLARATVAGYCVDSVVHNLTGSLTVDASDASLPFLDVRSRRYSLEAMELCGVVQWRHLLPEPAPANTIFFLDDRGSSLLGLPVGTPVTAGPYDLQACGFGSGTTRASEGTLVVGTTLSCQVLTLSAEIDPSAEPAGMWLCTPDPAVFLRVMPSMVGTASIDWLLDLFGMSAADLNGLLLLSPPGANGVEVLAFLSPSGERAPFVDPLARGRIDGLHLQHTRADLVRGLCESLAFAARHCFEALKLDGELAACGGGLKSDEWASIFADVIGRPLHLPLDSAVGARGAALTAWSSLGNPVDEELWRSQRRRLEPNHQRREIYEGLYQAYLVRLQSARSQWKG